MKGTPNRTERGLEIDLELKTTYETPISGRLDIASFQVTMSQNRVSEIPVSPTVLWH
jgi:hypothetical protein